MYYQIPKLLLCVGQQGKSYHHVYSMLLSNKRQGLGLVSIRPTSYPLYRGIVSGVGGVLRPPPKIIPFHAGQQLSHQTIVNAPDKPDIVAVEPVAIPDMRPGDAPPLLNKPPTQKQEVKSDVSSNFKPLYVTRSKSQPSKRKQKKQLPPHKLKLLKK